MDSVDEAMELLAGLPAVKPHRRFDERVAYLDACHLLHGQKISAEPRRLLGSVPGLTVVDIPDTELCCGSAGIYNVVNYDLSMEILSKKMAAIRSTGVRVAVTANPPCMFQVRYGAYRDRMDLRDRAREPNRTHRTRPRGSPRPGVDRADAGILAR